MSLAQNEIIFRELGLKNYLSMEVLNSIMGLETEEIARVFFPEMNEKDAIELTHRCMDYETYGNTGFSKDKNIRLILERSGFETGIYIGDTMKDCLVCEKANIPMIFVSCGFGHVENPWKRINSFDELLNVLN